MHVLRKMCARYLLLSPGSVLVHRQGTPQLTASSFALSFHRDVCFLIGETKVVFLRIAPKK